MRIALERLPVDEIEAVLDVDPARPDRAFAGLMAVAQGSGRDLKPILDALGAGLATLTTISGSPGFGSTRWR